MLKMGVARAGRGRAVAVHVDPNVQKKSQNFPFFSGGYPRFSQPAKTAYQHRERLGKSFIKSNACVGRFWCDQLPCRTRLRVHAAHIEEEWQRAVPLECGTGPAELKSLHEMAAQCWQDTQYERRQGANSAVETNTEIRVHVLPRCANIRASLPAPRALTTCGPQASHTEATLRGPLGPGGRKNATSRSAVHGPGKS